jgi:hypothetical protein
MERVSVAPFGSTLPATSALVRVAAAPPCGVAVKTLVLVP